MKDTLRSYIRRNLDDLKVGEGAVLDPDHGTLRNMRATIVQLYGPGRFATTTGNGLLYVQRIA